MGPLVHFFWAQDIATRITFQMFDVKAPNQEAPNIYFPMKWGIWGPNLHLNWHTPKCSKLMGPLVHFFWAPDIATRITFQMFDIKAPNQEALTYICQ